MSDRPMGRRPDGWSRRCLAATLAVGLLAVSACGDDAPTASENTTEAVRLYVTEGYRPVAPFGPYAGDLLSLCFVKAL